MPTNSRTVKDAFSYWAVSLVILTTSLIWLWLCQPQRHGWDAPISYRGDALFSVLQVKNALSGNYGLIPQLGFPYGLNLLDFPMADSSNVVIIRALGLVSSDPWVVTNLFFWLSFVLAAVSAYLTSRCLGINAWWSFLIGLLYAFAPYHLVRNVQHLLLGQYCMAPWVLLLSVQIINPTHLTRVIPWWGVVAIAWLSATMGIYYAFFSLMILGVSTIIQGVNAKKITVNRMLLLFGAVWVAGLVFNLAPNIKYWRQAGSNPLVGQRLPSEVENNGLKLYQLITPLQTYGLGPLERYAQKQGENLETRQYLGIPAVIGLFAAFVYLFFPQLQLRPKVKAASLALALSQLTIGILTLSLASGVGSLIALLISPQIRAYNRMIPYLAVLCLWLVFWWIQKYVSSLPRSRQLIVALLITSVGILSLVDQVSWFRLPSDQTRAEIKSDRDFVSLIESQLEPNAAIYQLPHKAFPETPPVHQLSDYELLKGYLFSHRLNWSYASMKGRPPNEQLANLAQLPLEEQLQQVKAKGFSGVYIDRAGYPDHARTLEASLSALLQRTPLVSYNQRLSFFDIR